MIFLVFTLYKLREITIEESYINVCNVLINKLINSANLADAPT